MFTLPDQLPATAAELSALADDARRSINVIQARHAAGEELSSEDVTDLRRLLGDVDTINAAHAEASTAEAAHAASVAQVIEQANVATGATAAVEPEVVEGEVVDETVAEVVAEAEAITEAGTDVVVAGARAPVRFAAGGTVDAPDARPAGPGWEMVPGAPGYRVGRVGFAELGLAIDAVRSGRKARSNRPETAGFAAQALAQLRRDVPLIDDPHALVAEIERATNQSNLPNGSLIAAGGWCAPSEQLYDFCDVPDAVDLISLPEITINRGGIRWPVEPDLTGIFDSFQFFFTEPELEAVDGEQNPTAIKECVSIPCPDDFEEIRLNAVGYCVEAGILQTQGWPELITWFMQQLVAEHLRAISRRTILDIVAGSGAPKLIAAGNVFGTVSALLNSLALQATNLRLNKGLARNATIEGVAPSWFAEVIRADLAMQEGLDTKDVGDAMITGWFAARNIALQFVGDWQTRETNLPGNLATLRWPGHVDIVLYPAGTWFRSMSNVIELGVLYPKEQLQVNRYTRFFTEDAIAVGKRCQQSIVVRVPIANDGAISARVGLTYSDTTPGSTFAPVETDAAEAPDRHVTITGSPTGGTVTFTLNGTAAAALAYNATAEAVYENLASVYATGDGNLAGALPSDVTVTGGPGPGAPWLIKGLYGTLTVASGLTGGTSPAVAITLSS